MHLKILKNLDFFNALMLLPGKYLNSSEKPAVSVPNNSIQFNSGLKLN